MRIDLVDDLNNVQAGAGMLALPGAQHVLIDDGQGRAPAGPV